MSLYTNDLDLFKSMYKSHAEHEHLLEHEHLVEHEVLGGWLAVKRCSGGRWEKSFFSLRGRTLYRFSSSRALKPLEKRDVTWCVVQEADEFCHVANSICLRTPGDPSLFLQADCQAEARLWLDTLSVRARISSSAFAWSSHR